MIKGAKKKELYRYKIGSMCKTKENSIGKVIAYINDHKENTFQELVIIEIKSYDDNHVVFNSEELNQYYATIAKTCIIEDHLGQPIELPYSNRLAIVDKSDLVEKLMDESDRIKVKIKLPKHG